MHASSREHWAACFGLGLLSRWQRVLSGGQAALPGSPPCCQGLGWPGRGGVVPGCQPQEKVNWDSW